LKELEIIGFSNEIRQDLMIQEPLDVHGNFIEWKCVAVALNK